MGKGNHLMKMSRCDPTLLISCRRIPNDLTDAWGGRRVRMPSLGDARSGISSRFVPHPLELFGFSVGRVCGERYETSEGEAGEKR